MKWHSVNSQPHTIQLRLLSVSEVSVTHNQWSLQSQTVCQSCPVSWEQLLRRCHSFFLWLPRWRWGNRWLAFGCAWLIEASRGSWRQTVHAHGFVDSVRRMQAGEKETNEAHKIWAHSSDRQHKTVTITDSWETPPKKLKLKRKLHRKILMLFYGIHRPNHSNLYMCMCQTEHMSIYLNHCQSNIIYAYMSMQKIL